MIFKFSFFHFSKNVNFKLIRIIIFIYIEIAIKRKKRNTFSLSIFSLSSIFIECDKSLIFFVVFSLTNKFLHFKKSSLNKKINSIIIENRDIRIKTFNEIYNIDKIDDNFSTKRTRSRIIKISNFSSKISRKQSF